MIPRTWQLLIHCNLGKLGQCGKYWGTSLAFRRELERGCSTLFLFSLSWLLPFYWQARYLTSTLARLHLLFRRAEGGSTHLRSTIYSRGISMEWHLGSKPPPLEALVSPAPSLPSPQPQPSHLSWCPQVNRQMGAVAAVGPAYFLVVGRR